ncbi:acyl-CoA dehydrogenase family protein [Pseudonocardia acaciae]|uniref:acyl-CoA dehydrogenase family protein n=1 Tax=Pseudonocardia acaciae TaxID=551276 RepID=UPI0004908A1A|nr:acyl-CoA dehydrogenase [Pseudonocardia acaciae]
MDFTLTAEQRDLREAALRLARDHFARDAFRRDGYAWDSARTLAKAGFTGIMMSEEDGGQGGTLFDAVLVMEAVSQVCPHSGDAVQATNFGAIRQVSELASAELKREVLPGLLAGDALVAAGMSEPGAGSALTELRTTARYDGADVVLDGQKCWTTHGPELTHLVVWCRFGERNRDIGAVLVPADAPGFSRGATERYMSGEATCVTYLDGCRVPRRYVLADSGALRRLMTVFGVERTGNAVRALALAQLAFDKAVEHAGTREQFGRPLCEFQGLQWKFADMLVQLEAARLLIYRAAVDAGTGPPDPMNATMAKLYANEAAFKVANEALQVLGASGYSTQFPLEYIARRVRGWMIAGGSLEILRNRLAEGIFDRRFSQRAEARP